MPENDQQHFRNDSSRALEAQLNQTVLLLNRLDASVQKIADAAQSLSVSVAVQGQKIEDLQRTMADVILSQQKQSDLMQSVNTTREEIKNLQSNMTALQTQVAGMNKLRWVVTGIFMAITTFYEAAQNGFLTFSSHLH